MSIAPPPDALESDFSPRKMRIALVALIGGLFRSNLLPFGALTFAMLPMTQEFGWSRTEFSWATTALMLCGSCAIPFMGRAADRLGVRPVILIGTGAVGLVTLAVAHVGRNPWPFWLCFALLGAFGCSAIAYTKVTAALFTRHRGKALAVFGAESAVVMAVSPILTNYLVENYGWRGMFTTYGFLILAILPLVFFLLPEPHALPGQSAWRRAPAADRQQRGAPLLNVPGMTAGEAVRDRVFWTLVIASICAMAPGAGLMNHLVAAVVDKGFTPTLAANIGAFSMLLGVVWTMLGGWAADRVQSARINVPFLLFSALGMFLFAIVTPMMGGVALLLVAYSLQGMGLTAGRPMQTYFQTRFFGMRCFAEISAIQSAPLSIAMGLAAPIMGMIYDTTHSYQLAFTSAIVGLLIAAGLFLTLGRYRFAVTDANGQAAQAADAPAVAEPAIGTRAPAAG